MERKDENKNDEKKKENNSIIKEQLNNNSKLHIKIEENKNKKNGVIRNVNNVDLDKIKNLSVEDKERNEILMNKILNKNTKINEIFELINSPNSMRNKRNKKSQKKKMRFLLLKILIIQILIEEKTLYFHQYQKQKLRIEVNIVKFLIKLIK